MELIIRTNDPDKIAKILALARELGILVEQKVEVDKDNIDREELKRRILDFKASGPSSFGDALEWQKEVRKDRKLPFSKLRGS